MIKCAAMRYVASPFLLVLLVFAAPVFGQPQPKTAVIRFYGTVTGESVGKLLSVVDAKIKEGNKRIVLLISSPGGEVFAGLTAYHYLKGVPVEVITHNFGAVDSIATVIYCAGSKRYSVPQGRFLLHGVSLTFPPGVAFDEGIIDEQLKGMQQDIKSIATVIAETVNRPIQDIQAIILKRTILGAEEAQKWGLAQEIHSKLYDEGDEVTTIASNERIKTPLQILSAPPELRMTTSSTAYFTKPQQGSTIKP